MPSPFPGVNPYTTWKVRRRRTKIEVKIKLALTPP
jgi:hypothetical protein